MHRKHGIRTGLAALALCAFAAPASATFELGIGLSDEIAGDSTGFATLSWLSDARHPLELTIGHIQKRDDSTRVSSPTTTYVAAGTRFRWRRWFFATGIALTDTDTDDEVLSGNFQFQNGIGWASERWSVSVRHLSNASTVGRNRGETFLIVGLMW